MCHSPIPNTRSQATLTSFVHILTTPVSICFCKKTNLYENVTQNCWINPLSAWNRAELWLCSVVCVHLLHCCYETSMEACLSIVSNLWPLVVSRQRGVSDFTLLQPHLLPGQEEVTPSCLLPPLEIDPVVTDVTDVTAFMNGWLMSTEGKKLL